MAQLEMAGTDSVYSPDWESLDLRPCQSWFDEAKFGIFIHWGPYSVPAWAPKRRSVQRSGEAYAEWYGWAMRNPDSKQWAFHRRVYGENTDYRAFAELFKAEMFDPDQWASLFARSGARYVTLTSKHHDGYCLWPSSHSEGWNSVSVGPKRDLIADLKEKTDEKGLRFGLYYSLSEWDHPLYRTNPSLYAKQHMIPQLKDLVIRYEPSLLFGDGEWSYPSDVWGTRDFLAWLFNESPVRDTIVINDRWGSETRNRHGGYYTSEYGHVDGRGTRVDIGHKWEENRGIGASFGYNRNEDLEDYLSEAELIHLLITIVSRGGNLLLGVGPTADGRIPVIMQERLIQLGDWLAVNGEAVYGTTAYVVHGQDDWVWFTVKDGSLYAHCLKWPGTSLTLRLPELRHSIKRASLLGFDQELAFRWDDQGVSIAVPQLSVDEIPCRHAYVFKIETVSRTAVRCISG